MSLHELSTCCHLGLYNLKLSKKVNLKRGNFQKWMNIHFLFSLFPVYTCRVLSKLHNDFCLTAHQKLKCNNIKKWKKGGQNFIFKGALFFNFVSHLFWRARTFLVQLHIVFRSFDCEKMEKCCMKKLIEHHSCRFPRYSVILHRQPRPNLQRLCGYFCTAYWEGARFVFN